MLNGFKIIDPKIYSTKVRWIYRIINLVFFLGYVIMGGWLRKKSGIKREQIPDQVSAKRNRSGMTKSQDDRPKKILLVKKDTIGDLVLAVPTIRAIRRKFPKSEITLLIAKSNRGLLDNCPYVDKIKYFDPYWFLPGSFKKWLGYMAKSGTSGKENQDLLKELKREHFDLGIDLRGNLFTIWLLYRINAKERMSFDICGGGYFLTQKVPYIRDAHEVEHALELAKFLGVEIEKEKYLELWVEKEAREKVRRRLKDKGIRENDFLIGLNPGGRWEYRLWSAEKFARLGDKLAKDYNAKVVILKGPGEEAADKVLNKMKSKAVCFQGTLPEVTALLKELDFLVTNDTGPMHMAAALNTPLVALFGPGNHKFLYPYSKNSAYVRKNLDCSPCEQRKCIHPDNNCMAQITLEEVLKASNKILNLCKSKSKK